MTVTKFGRLVNHDPLNRRFAAVYTYSLFGR